MLGRKIRDSAPDTKPAGKVWVKGHGTRECMDFSPVSEGRDRTPDGVRRMRGVFRPEPGVPWDSCRRTGDPPVDPDLSHGVKTVSSLKASHLVNPDPKTKFQLARIDRKEAVYSSSKNKPLGKIHDQSEGLPEGMDTLSTSFGKKTPKSLSLGEVVMPNIPPHKLEEEFEKGRELYKKSHNDWDVGEIMDRNYDWSVFTKDSKYGVETPHDNRGVLVSSTMDWGKNTDNRKVVAKRLDDFREKTQPQLAATLDPMVDSRDVPPDFTFGCVVPVDEYGAGALTRMEGPNTYLECTALDSGILASIRTHLKKQKFNNFDCFLEALRDKDKERSGVVPIDVVHDVAFHFRVPVTFNMLEMLARWTTKRGEAGGVAYEDLVTLINWDRDIDEEKLDQIAEYTHAPDHTPSAPATPLSKLDLSDSYKTSSQAYRGATGELSTRKYKTFGVPTVRTDLPAPHLKRVSDHKNYGDETDSGVLLYPSIYSSHGVYEEDFFRPHPPERIREIFKKIGVEMSTEVFDKLWAEAARRDPKGRGEVCVETFRMVAEEVKVQQVEKELSELAAATAVHIMD